MAMVAPVQISFYTESMLITPHSLSQITINGEARSITTPASVSDLVTELALDPRKVAIECNGTIVPRSQYSTVTINNGDQFEIVGFIGGG